MAERCKHIRAAVIASDARLFSSEGEEARGDIRWCTQCGAVIALVQGGQGVWLKPGTEACATAYQHMCDRQAALAEQPRGKGRVAHG